jgi:S-adenosylmethionine decarboxylase proenzyme
VKSCIDDTFFFIHTYFIMAGNNTRSPYKVKVSHRFISASLLLSVLVAFAVGRTARIYLLLQNADKAIQQSAGANLPNPVLQKGKIPPQSIYSSKHFDTALASSSNSRWIIIEDEPQECSSDANTTEMDFDDDEVHLPKGQHLLLDIRHVDSEFLGSEERLAHTMMNVVNSCGLTLLSYHCHGLKPAGVSCVGILLESHVSFHTFPSQGVIIFDLFTCGDSSLLPIVPAAVKAFSVPRTATPAAAMKSHTKTSKSKTILPEPVWAYKFRGYGADNEDTIDQLTDFFTFPIGAMTDYKKEVRRTKI